MNIKLHSLYALYGIIVSILILSANFDNIATYEERISDFEIKDEST